MLSDIIKYWMEKG